MILRYFILLFFCITGTIATFEDLGVFCQAKEDDYRICRTCDTDDKKCTQDPDDCFCENIELQNPSTEKLTGSRDCKDGFCYVSQDSKCTDVLTPEGYDPIAYAKEPGKDVWNHQKIFKSTKACQSNIKFDLGNEKIMEDMKITDNYLHELKQEISGDTVTLDPTAKEPFKLYTDTHEECMEECHLRCGQCGAWSYNDLEGECYLHTADACCGQKGKQVSTSGWISGYFCIKCWSTEAGAECPCSLQKRLEGQLGCYLAQSSGAADDPQYKNPTGLLEVHTIKLKEDVCACQPKRIKRRRRTRIICRKPLCFDQGLNPGGKCKDQRRCRKPRPKRNQG